VLAMNSIVCRTPLGRRGISERGTARCGRNHEGVVGIRSDVRIGNNVCVAQLLSLVSASIC
jgi:hypothetical protein